MEPDEGLPVEVDADEMAELLDGELLISDEDEPTLLLGEFEALRLLLLSDDEVPNVRLGVVIGLVAGGEVEDTWSGSAELVA
tara:strand:+ start:3572 stop:3817 length:246 start_codon:yes stop_codon:yes gene_type:complete